VVLAAAGREPTQTQPQHLELLTQAVAVAVAAVMQQAAQMGVQAAQA
jgi:hypothetical protein